MNNPVKAQARTYYPALDGVRALATLMIIVFHLAQMGVPIPGPTIIGQTGVDLFFVLSGFLITSILLKARERDWSEVRSFYIRRSLRIFPLYFGYLLVATLIGTLFSPWSWIYLQNIAFAFGRPMGHIGHFWSLAIEEQFYFVWPFLVLFISRRHLVPVLWLTIAGAGVCRILLLHHIEIFYLTITRADTLAAGALVALYLYQGKLQSYHLQMAIVNGLSLLFLIAEAVVFKAQRNTFVEVTRYTLICCFYATIIGLLIVSKPSVFTLWLRTRSLRYMGRVSYGIYVFHPEAFRLSFEHFQGKSMAFRVTGGFLLTATFTLLSWYVWERPFLKLKNRFPTL